MGHLVDVSYPGPGALLKHHAVLLSLFLSRTVLSNTAFLLNYEDLGQGGGWHAARFN